MQNTKRCQTCELVARRDRGEAPPWDAIYRSQYWDVVHSFNTSLPGWLVLVARRHMAAVDEMNDEEAVELGRLIRRVSLALKEATGCVKTYVVQFAESPDHPHVHFHLVPRLADQPEDHAGPNVFRYLGVADEERVGEERMNELAAQVQASLRGNQDMSTQPTMAEILPRIEQSIQRVVQAVTALPEAARVEPLLPGDRSVKDVLGHITWWDQWLLLTLPPAPGEPAAAITLPLADQIPPNDHWADAMNAKVLAYNKLRAFTPIWQEFNATWAALVKRVSQLSAADLYDPAGMSATIGQPVAPLVCGIYEHYEEHAHEFESLKA